MKKIYIKLIGKRFFGWHPHFKAQSQCTALYCVELIYSVAKFTQVENVLCPVVLGFLHFQ